MHLKRPKIECKELLKLDVSTLLLDDMVIDCPKLTHISLTMTPLSEASLVSLFSKSGKNLIGLKMLHSKSELTLSLMKMLPKLCPNLRLCNFMGSKICNEGASILARELPLRRLYLTNCVKIDPEIMQQVKDETGVYITFWFLHNQLLMHPQANIIT